MVFLIFGRGYFTFLYQLTKSTTEGVERKKNKQTRTWVCSKCKKEEVCDIFVQLCVSVGQRERVFEQNSHKPWAMPTYLLALVNPASVGQQVLAVAFQTFVDRSPLCPALISWLTFSWLHSPADCSLLLTVSFSLLWDLYSLVQSRGRSHARALCVGFTPKQIKGSSDWHTHTHPHNECPASCNTYYCNKFDLH